MRNIALIACVIALIGCAVGLLAIAVMLYRDTRSQRKLERAELVGAKYEYSIDDDGHVIRIPVNYAALRSLSDTELLELARYKYRVEQLAAEEPKVS